MDAALTGSNSQLVGGFVVGMLYAVIGVLSAIGSIVVFRRIFQGRWEQIFWSWFLVAIAAFYLSFAAYFGAQAKAWQTELVFVALILACAVCGLFYRPAIAFGFAMHGLWDIDHSLFGSSLFGLPTTEIPVGYGMLCLTFDLTVAGTAPRLSWLGVAKVSSPNG